MKNLKKEVLNSNKQHNRLRRSAKTNQERKYHMACVMSQVSMNKLLTKKQKRELWEVNR